MTKRLRTVLAVISAAAALSAAAGWRAAPVLPAPSPPTVILYDDAGFDGSDGQLAISTSRPDLSQNGWADRISSLRILGGISIAVYSQPDYTGTCDNFVGDDPWLGNNVIGNDQIVSVRLYYNCAGPVVDPVVVDMTSIHGSSDQIQCPPDYVKREQDLNQGVGGDFVYLCLLYESKATAGNSALSTVNTTASLISALAMCDSGGTRVDGDLNAGAGGEFVYLCYWTLANDYPDPVGRIGASLRDVEFITHTGPVDLGQLQTQCEGTFEDVVDGSVSPNDAHLIEGDLNSGASGSEQIYACTLNHEIDLAPTPNLTTPLITFAGITPAPDAAGWNNTPVTLTWDCTDPLGVVSPQVTVKLTTEGADQSAEGVCQDPNGNVATNLQTGVNLDFTPPAITFLSRTPPNANGWNNTPVAVKWTCSDALSGPVHQAEEVTVSTQGTNQSATGTCEDLAGNTVSDRQTGINIDTTAPTLTPAVSPAPNGFGWNRGDVTVTWTCNDTGGSGLEGSCPGSTTITGEGVGLSAFQSISDRAGNQTNASALVNIDRTPPQISAPTLTPAANSQGWRNGDVTVTWMCSDTLSGVPAPSVSQVVTGQGSNLSATGTCQDRAGNKTSNTVAGIKIDRTAPVLSVHATTASGATYTPGTWTNQNVTVTFTCTDQLSGVASTTAPQTVSANGANQQVTGNCADNAGNQASATFSGIDIDKTAPTMTCSPRPTHLWPANNKLVPVSVSVKITDGLSGPGPFTLVSATSNQPGHGDIRGFKAGTADTHGQLRAKRSGNHTRIYTLTYRGTDKAGNTATCHATVKVAPH